MITTLVTVANCGGQGIGGIRRYSGRKVEQRSDHILHLGLTGAAIPYDGHFDFRRGVLVHRHPTFRRSQQGHSPGLT
jgi:hypothetical protein